MMQTDSIPQQMSDSTAGHAAPVRIQPHANAVRADIVQADTTAVDSLAADTLAPAPRSFGICLTAPPTPEVAQRVDNSFGMSCVVGMLALLFCIIGLRFRDNHKYIAVMLHNMVEVRIRGNVFDETVRETSFLVLLNLLWSCSAGIILWAVLCHTAPVGPAAALGFTQLPPQPGLATGICIGVAVAYTCFMALAYVTVGTVFYDAVHGRMWVKGFAAGLGVLGIIWLPISLLLLFYPQWTEILLYIALATFILAKIVFIWKGFRIFFTQISSWVLFLYYLCSLEIVPLILTYLAALQLCSLL